MVQLEDLDDDCLIQVLERLPPKILFKMLQVNKRWKRLAVVKIQTKIVAIAISEPNNLFSDCAHLDSIKPDNVLFLPPTLKPDIFRLVKEKPKIILFLSVLSKCPRVKSIDFSYFNLTFKILLKAVRLCPDLECIKVQSLTIKEDEWGWILNQIGHRIVHFVKKKWIYHPVNTTLLKMLAKKCPNIKQIHLELYLTSDLMAALKILPNSCWRRLVCHRLSRELIAVEDVIDELVLENLIDWSQFAGRFDRLSNLKLDAFQSFPSINPILGVDFAGLKRLDLSQCLTTYDMFNQLVNGLLASRFPQLEEFCFNAGVRFTEDNYDTLFRRMPSVKKLAIYCNHDLYSDLMPKLPGLAAIHQLENLDTIYLNLCNVYANWRSEGFIQQLEKYVYEIDSMKKLTLEVGRRTGDEWIKKLEDGVERMKVKQSRVKIDLV